MLPSPYRLPSQEITQVMRRGKRISDEAIQLVYRDKRQVTRDKVSARFVPPGGTPLGRPRFAFIVSTKIDKRAVVRNRMKRLMRESVSHILPRISDGVDGVLVARRGLAGLSQKEVEDRIIDLFKRIEVLNNES